ncbi:ribosomal L7Ae/L30e/S12e/Gadd45 family protein [Selenomonas noxia]|uniref:ribosomal L7Ae/L30e/S12e/Gadd45 family protein n=1 Tax=Selenomonas noxia TaxID=135083 RepID=UPI0032C0694A
MSLEKLRTARTVAGIHQVCKAVLSGEAETVFIAADVDDRVLGPLLAACREKGIVPERAATKAELGERARLDVSAAAVATLR